VSRLAHQFAIESDHVDADVIEVAEFPDLAARFDVTGVPKTLVHVDGQQAAQAELLGSLSGAALATALGV